MKTGIRSGTTELAPKKNHRNHRIGMKDWAQKKIKDRDYRTNMHIFTRITTGNGVTDLAPKRTQKRT